MPFFLPFRATCSRNSISFFFISKKTKVPDELQAVALDLLERLAAADGVGQTWIATRPHLRRRLEDRFRSMALTLAVRSSFDLELANILMSTMVSMKLTKSVLCLSSR